MVLELLALCVATWLLVAGLFSSFVLFGCLIVKFSDSCLALCSSLGERGSICFSLVCGVCGLS